MAAITEDEDQSFDEAFSRAVDLGNQIADADEKADLWDVADGLLAGAVQYWLYTRQPCGDPSCEDCLAVGAANTAAHGRAAPPRGGILHRKPILSCADRLERRPRLEVRGR